MPPGEDGSAEREGGRPQRIEPVPPVAPRPSPAGPLDPHALFTPVPSDARLPAGAPVLVGVPLGRPEGSSACEDGPGALRAALRGFSTYRGEPAGDLRTLGAVSDLGNLKVTASTPQVALALIRQAAAGLFRMGVRPIFVGGSHLLTEGVLGGLSAALPGRDAALIVLDAHLDTREEEDSGSLVRGAPFTPMLRAGLARGTQTAVVGLRPFANSRMFTEWMRESGVHLIMVDDFAHWGPERAAQVVLERIAGDGRPIYLSVDLDVLDPAYAPGTTHACPGGLSSRELTAFLHGLLKRARLLGADIAELAPSLDSGDRTAKLAGRLLLEILAAFAAQQAAE